MAQVVSSPFLLTVCQVGAEPTLKVEIQRAHPELKFSYSRPGFVTFRKDPAQGQIRDDFRLGSVFARAYALSIGRASRADEALKIAIAHLPRGAKLRLHVWERDRYAPGEEPQGYVPDSGALKFEAELWESIAAAQVSDSFFNEPEAESGDWVASFVGIEDDEWWVGIHRHSSDHGPFAGGRYPFDMPACVPSRAYAKLEEMIAWQKIPIQKDDVAVEIGSAPGGAVFALLNRGLRVVGIDPGTMDPRVTENKNYKHIERAVAQVPREELPHQVHWLLVDMNVAPHTAIFQVDRLATRLMHDGLLGLILTFKLNQWKYAEELPGWVDHLQAMGMVRIKAQQLLSHRQELGILALTPLGMSRMSKRSI